METVRANHKQMPAARTPGRPAGRYWGKFRRFQTVLTFYKKLYKSLHEKKASEKAHAATREVLDVKWSPATYRSYLAEFRKLEEGEMRE